MKVVILAGGYGTRLAEETDRVPKPMVEIGGRPILWHIMKTYAHHGHDDFIVCLGYLGHKIKEYFINYFLLNSDVTFDLSTGEYRAHRAHGEKWKVSLIDTEENTQTGGRLKRIRSYLDDGPFCFTYGDAVSDIDVSRLVDFHRSHGKLATVTAVQPPGRFGVLSMQGEKVAGFAEKLDTVNSYINAGFFVLEPAALDYIEGDHTLWEQEPMHRLASDGQLQGYRHGGFWQPMDTLRDKRRLEQLWTDGAPWKVWG
ncbi:MAG: glucose-1-phosphate cytidylyltransferase [Alphaproteobacteria bacterium]|nr:glucose-1-phosphate cytidylyltransferase [Alphaproteobacteria bacterium]